MGRSTRSIFSDVLFCVEDATDNAVRRGAQACAWEAIVGDPPVPAAWNAAWEATAFAADRWYRG